MEQLKAEPSRPPGSALGSGMGGGPGGGQGTAVVAPVTDASQNSSVEQKFSTPLSPQNPTAARTAGGFWSRLWG